MTDWGFCDRCDSSDSENKNPGKCAHTRVREKTSTLGFRFYFAKEKEKKQHHFTHKPREINFHQPIFL